MRTNVVLNDDLVAEALKYSRFKTRKELLNEALREFVENHRRRDLRELRGKIEFHEGYDYKEMRRGK